MVTQNIKINKKFRLKISLVKIPEQKYSGIAGVKGKINSIFWTILKSIDFVNYIHTTFS